MQIRVRAWDTKRQRMITEPYAAGLHVLDGQITPMLHFDGTFSLMADDDGGKSGLWEHDLVNHRDEGRYIIEIYTGLQDENGRPIFQGDKLWDEVEDMVAIVTSEEGCWIVEYGEGDTQYLCRMAPYSQVIGHIHEEGA